MKAVIDTLLTVSLYAAIVAGALLLFRALFKKRISPRLQYLMWVLLFARLILPITVESGFHVENLFPAPAALDGVVSKDTAPDAQPADFTLGAVLIDSGVPAALTGVAPALPPPKAPVDYYALCFWVWVGGMGIYALWMGLSSLRYSRRTRERRVQTPPAVAALYAQCLAETRISRSLPLWVVDAAMSPGIAPLGRPVLLMPIGMLQNPAALRFAMLHELTHYKRGDPIACMVMNALRMAHWFNPVVHLAFSVALSDMETACDFDVMRGMGNGEKKGYLTTIINLFSFEAWPQLGMARSRTRRMAEQRVKGAFMKATTTIGAKMLALLLGVTLLLTCFTTACQAAPANGATLEKVNSEPSTNEQPAPTAARMANGESDTGKNEPVIRGSYSIIISTMSDLDKTQAELIRRMAYTLDGCSVQPHEEWSFNDFFSTLTKSDDWEAASSIADGVPQTAEAKGVMSTAIYCALLTADIEVTEHSTHSSPPNYVNKGLDATVDSGGIDLKFVNSTADPLRFRVRITEPNENRLELSVEMIGEPLPDGVSYAIKSEISKTFPYDESTAFMDDPTLPEGMRAYYIGGRDGYEVDVYRDTIKNRETVKSELLYTASYRPNSDIWKRGTKPPYALSDMTKAELTALARLLQTEYRYDSSAHTFDEDSTHYSELFRALEVDCGGMMKGDPPLDLGFTIGVPMREFVLEKCYPYAAVIFALDPNVGNIDIGSLAYHVDGTDSVALSPADIAWHYKDVLDQPLSYYAQSPERLADFMIKTAKFKG